MGNQHFNSPQTLKSHLQRLILLKLRVSRGGKATINGSLTPPLNLTSQGKGQIITKTGYIFTYEKKRVLKYFRLNAGWHEKMSTDWHAKTRGNWCPWHEVIDYSSWQYHKFPWDFVIKAGLYPDVWSRAHALHFKDLIRVLWL